MIENKSFYGSYADHITEKRAQSPFPLRRYAHDQQYRAILAHIQPGMRVLDAGCGEGVLSFMMAEKGAEVIGVDLSGPNIEAAAARASQLNLQNVSFLVGDAESLPFSDNSFDLVVSSHVLEHVPDFDRGLKEVMRVTKRRAVVAIPTALNGCSFVQLGRGWFYLKGLRSFAALPIGAARVLAAYVLGKEGVDEGYAGTGMTHVFRFPRILKEKAEAHGFSVVGQEASTLCLPYFASLLPITRALDRHKRLPPLNAWGYGTTYVLEKQI